MISENLNEIRNNISECAKKVNKNESDITLVAVTKTKPVEDINEAIRCGVTDIGENKVQEILEKYDKVLPVKWHLIGHLQTNKVKYIIDKVDLIHSVDSIHLLDEIERQASIHNREMDVLIQVNISGEESKFGIEASELSKYFEYVGHLKFVKILGLMTILPKCCDNVTQDLLFDNINRIFIDNKAKKYDNVIMKHLSMGMSGDYKEAIVGGSNMVRIGSKIFGERNYV